MSLDIQAIAQTGLALAKSLAAQAFVTVTIRMGPTRGTYDPANDSHATTTWAQEVSLQALPYDDENERRDEPLETNMRTFLVDMSDLEDSGIDQNGQIDEGGTIWNIYRTEIDPSRSVVLFYTRR